MATSVSSKLSLESGQRGLSHSFMWTDDESTAKSLSITGRNAGMMDPERRGDDRPHDRFDCSFGSSTSSLGEFDLGENYQSAVECVLQCRSLLASQDRVIAAKDRELARLRLWEKEIGLKDKELALARLRSWEREIALKDEELVGVRASKDAELALKEQELAQKDAEIKRLNEELASYRDRDRDRPQATSQNERLLMERLAVKDEQIGGLEETLVQMSLELASSKAQKDIELLKKEVASCPGRDRPQATSHDEGLLREQLAVKDEQIVGLEEKLVQMSLELASAKTREGEQLHQFKRRMSGINKISVEAVSGGDDDDDDDDDEKCAPRRGNLRRQESTPVIGRRQQQQSRQEQRFSTTSARIVRRKPSSRRHPARRGLSRSWSGLSSTSQEADAIAQLSAEIPIEVSDRTHPPGHGLGQRLSKLSQRMNWTVDDGNDGRLDDNSKAALDESQTSTSTSTASAPRRISNIGQFLLGRAKNYDGGAEGEGEGEHARAARREERERRGSLPITHAEIGSGVIFPVSSADCLVGLDPSVADSVEFRARRGI